MSKESETLSRMRGIMQQWGDTERWCAEIHSEIEFWSTQIQSLYDPKCTQTITGMPGSGKISDNTATTAIRDMEAEAEYRSQINFAKARRAKRMRLKELIDELVDDLSPMQSDAIKFRYKTNDTYPYGMHWCEVAVAMTCDERQAKRFEARALLKLSSFVLYYLG